MVHAIRLLIVPPATMLPTGIKHLQEGQIIQIVDETYYY